jgi:GNAT superfamily N-acetyltransferase
MPDSRSFDVVLADGRRTTVRAVTDGDATAWAAFGDDSRDAVGVARLVVRSPRGSAEVEVAVARAYRERGLGKILFDTLVLTALELGVDRVVARVRADSWIGQKLRSRAGAVTRARTSRELSLEVPIVDEPQTLFTSRPLPRFTGRRSTV